MIADYQRQFIEFAIQSGVLQFGEFKLKSGRISPYFFNAGLFCSGESLSRLGQYYSAALMHSGMEFDLLFGPAYKGIPLASTTAISLYTDHGRNVPYVFNRKEIKGHGEGGQLVGAKLEGKIVIVDDVITAGTAIREVMEILDGSPVSVSAVLIAIDRQEKGNVDISAIQEVEQEYDISVISVVKLSHIVEHLEILGQYEKELALISQYRTEYGID
jgi:orotate phosphoribosyltransferase